MNALRKELADIYRFFFATPISHKEIVFYIEHRGYYPYMEGILAELEKTHHQPISYITSDFSDPILINANPATSVFYIKKFLPYVMALLNSRVCIMTVADLEHFYLRRSAYPVHYVYAFHALVSTHMMYREGAFDHYDSILCVGPHQIAEIREREQQEHLPPKRLVEAGYYPLERIYEAYRARPEKSSAQEKTVLIAPSWGEHNIFESVGEELIRNLLDKGYHVIARPHAELARRKPEVLENLNNAFGGNPRFVLETFGSPDEAILKADVLITDFSGIMFEYAFGTERPVLFIDVPPKVKNQNYRKIPMEPIELALRPKLGITLSPHEVGMVNNAVEELIAKRERFRIRIQELRSRYVFHFGNAAAVSAQEIMDTCNTVSS